MNKKFITLVLVLFTTNFLYSADWRSYYTVGDAINRHPDTPEVDEVIKKFRDEITLRTLSCAIHGRKINAVASILNLRPSLVNARDKYKESSLYYAAYVSAAPIVQLLMDKGAHVNAEEGFLKDTCLHHAVSREDDREAYTIAQLLLSHGANVNAVSGLGSTPLDVAIRAGNREAAELLSRHSGVRSDALAASAVAAISAMATGSVVDHKDSELS